MGSKLDPSHYLPQTGFLFQKPKCPVVDFIGKLENFEEDFTWVLNRINSTEMLKYKETHGIAQKNIYGSKAKIASLNGDLRNAYNNKSSMIKFVANAYPNDFINFGYFKSCSFEISTYPKFFATFNSYDLFFSPLSYYYLLLY